MSRSEPPARPRRRRRPRGVPDVLSGVTGGGREVSVRQERPPAGDVDEFDVEVHEDLPVWLVEVQVASRHVEGTVRES